MLSDLEEAVAVVFLLDNLFYNKEKDLINPNNGLENKNMTFFRKVKKEAKEVVKIVQQRFGSSLILCVIQAKRGYFHEKRYHRIVFIHR
jgi:hypothetical protein